MAKAALIVGFAVASCALKVEKDGEWALQGTKDSPRNHGVEDQYCNQDPEVFVNGVKATMESAPNDTEVQGKGCLALHSASNCGREGPGPYGGRRVSNKWITAGSYEVIAQGLLRIVAAPQNPELEDAQFDLATTCFKAIQDSTVINDKTKSVLMHRHSPHLWDALVGYLQRFRITQFDRLIVKGYENGYPLNAIGGLYGNWGGDEEDSLGEISRGLERAGGFKFILDILEHEYWTPAAFQGATAALSDHLVGSRATAKLFADKYDGIKVLMSAVNHAQFAYIYFSSEGFGVRYQVLEDVTGLLKNDDNGRFAKGFRKEGLLKEVVTLMPQEPNDLYLQEHCCQVLNWLTNSNPAAQRELAKSRRGSSLVRRFATEQCAPTCTWPPTVQRLNPTLSESNPPSCVFLNRNLEQHKQGTTTWKDWSMTEFQV